MRHKIRFQVGDGPSGEGHREMDNFFIDSDIPAKELKEVLNTMHKKYKGFDELFSDYEECEVSAKTLNEWGLSLDTINSFMDKYSEADENDKLISFDPESYCKMVVFLLNKECPLANLVINDIPYINIGGYGLFSC